MKHFFRIFCVLLYTSLQAQVNNSEQASSTTYLLTDQNKQELKSELKLSLGVIKTLKLDGTFESLNTSVISQISEIDMDGRKLLHLVTDNNSDFHLLKLSILEDSFEKIYFYEGIVKLNFFIQIDHGLPSNLAWVITPIKKESESAYAQIEKLITETKTISMKMSKSEKEQWLSYNSK